MLFKFKILSTETGNSFVGMFGDCIKVRLIITDEELHDPIIVKNKFTEFITHELSIPQDYVIVEKIDIESAQVEANLPDEAYEIVMSWVN